MVHHRPNAPSKSPSPFAASWKCNVCGETFVNPKSHADHVGSHSLEYPSSCPLCLSRFQTSADLKSHACAANNRTKNYNSGNESSSAPPISKNPIRISPPREQSDEEVIGTGEDTSVPANPSLPVSVLSATSSIDDVTDVEDAFESAQNPVRRSRSSSAETNNNLSDSGKADFFVADPWQASSAILNPYFQEDQESQGETDRSPPILEPMAKQTTDEFIEELIYPLQPQRRKSKTLPQTHRQAARRQKQPLPLNPLNKRHSKDNLPSSSVSVTSAKSHQGLSHITSALAAATAGGPVMHGEMGHHVAVAAIAGDNPPPPLLPPALDLLHLVSGDHELELTLAAHNVPEPSSSQVHFQNIPKTVKSYPVKELKCIPCHRRFNDYLPWCRHLVREHISQLSPRIVIEKLNVVDVGAEGPFRVGKDKNGNIAVAAKSPAVVYSESSIESCSTVSDITPATSAANEKKEALKLTFCRGGAGAVGQYIIKRNSTEGDNQQGNAESGTSQSASSTTPPTSSEESSSTTTTVDPEPEQVLPDLDSDDDTSKEGSVVGQPVTTATAGQMVPVRNTPPSTALPGTSTSTITQGQRRQGLGFKPRFINAIQTVRRNLQQRKLQELLSIRRPPRSAQPSDERQTETNASASGSKNSMTLSAAPEQSATKTIQRPSKLQENLVTDKVTKNAHPNHSDSNSTATNKEQSSRPAQSERNNSPVTTAPSPAAAAGIPRVEREGSSSPTIVFISEHKGNSATSTNLTTPKKEPVEAAAIADQPTHSPSSEVILPDNVAIPLPEREMAVEHEPDADNDDDSDSTLVIHMQEEETGVTPSDDKSNKDNSEGDQGEMCQDAPDEVTAVARRSSEGNNENVEKSPNQGSNGENNDVDDDFRCRVCSKVYTDEGDLQKHFESEHFRIRHSESVTVGGGSGIFEGDEVEEPDPDPYGNGSTGNVPDPQSTTLSALLTRRLSAEETFTPGSPYSNYVQTQLRGVVQHGMPMRQGLPVRAILPNESRLPTIINSEYPHRPGLRPLNRLPLAAGPHVGQISPFRHSYPATLHQALVSQPGPGPTSQAPPSRPPLRMMPGFNIRGATPQPPPSHLQNRPPLMRVPAPTQAQPNPQSILRTSLPPQQQIQQIENRVSMIRSRAHQLHQIRQQTSDPVHIHRLQQEEDRLTKSYYECQQHLSNLLQPQQLQKQPIQQPQQQHQSPQMHRQQLPHQIHREQLQLQQQLQQQQIRQQQQALPPPPRPTYESISPVPNTNGKRPAMEIFETSRSKQPRLDGAQESPPREERQPPGHPDEGGAVRIPEGVTVSILPADSESPRQLDVMGGPPSVPSRGSSAGSRHSSGPTSPAAASPSMVANRLAQSGITLTPTAPQSPLVPLSPPANPVLSPISEGSLSPRGSPRVPINTSVIQRVPMTNISPAAAQPAGGQNETTFAVPRAPVLTRTNSTGSGIVTNPGAERPNRPPTIDLTDDEIQSHNAQMRATGGGAVSIDQIQNHEASVQRRLAGIPGTGQFPIRPMIQKNMQHQQQPPHTNKIPCALCKSFFPSVEVLNDHLVNYHGQQQFLTSPPNVQTQQNFRPPPVAIRRSPPNTSNPPGNLGPAGPIRNNISPRGPPQLVQMRGPSVIAPSTRPQEVAQRSQASGDREKLVIPLLNLSRLDANKLRALNDMGVASFIPLEGITRLGIPIMRLQPDLPIGHFPHDTAIEIGPVERLGGNALPAPPAHPALPPPPPPNNILPNHGNPPPRPLQVPQVVSPPMGICTDRNCPDFNRGRVQGTSVVHHMNNSGISANHQHQQNIGGSAGASLNHQYHPHQQGIHDSFLGAQSNQLVVTQVNRIM